MISKLSVFDLTTKFLIYFYPMTEHIWKQDYIIVRTPKTVDGANVELDDEDRAIYKETEHPIAALRDFELANEKLPKAQKKKITVVRINEQITKPAPKKLAVQPEPEVEQPAKRGPKPKSNDLD